MTDSKAFAVLPSLIGFGPLFIWMGTLFPALMPSGLQQSPWGVIFVLIGLFGVLQTSISMYVLLHYVRKAQLLHESVAVNVEHN